MKEKIIKQLKSHANPKNAEGMKRFGISGKNILGIPIPTLRQMAKEIKKHEKDPKVRHALAQELWETGIHEALILAVFIDDPSLVTEEQMDSWVEDFDSWDVCDQVCANLFDKTKHAYKKAKEWAKREEEFVKRAGFALMACLAWHDKEAKNKQFLEFFPDVKNSSTDERNFVSKAVNWALRQIGKRNSRLLKPAIELAREIEQIEHKTARWIAKDALRELTK